MGKDKENNEDSKKTSRQSKIKNHETTRYWIYDSAEYKKLQNVPELTPLPKGKLTETVFKKPEDSAINKMKEIYLRQKLKLKQQQNKEKLRKSPIVPAQKITTTTPTKNSTSEEDNGAS